MPNRYHTPFSKQRVKSGGGPPADSKGTKSAKFEKEKSYSWPKVSGPRGTDFNKKTKFDRVKDAADRGNF